MARKTDMLVTLRKLLQDVFGAQYGGAHQERLSRAFGYADGYMRAMLDSGMASKQELLDVVVDERRQVLRGPDAVPSIEEALALTG
jgi:hypothetical protein